MRKTSMVVALCVAVTATLWGETDAQTVTCQNGLPWPDCLAAPRSQSSIGQWSNQWSNSGGQWPNGCTLAEWRLSGCSNVWRDINVSAGDIQIPRSLVIRHVLGCTVVVLEDTADRLVLGCRSKAGEQERTR